MPQYREDILLPSTACPNTIPSAMAKAWCDGCRDVITAFQQQQQQQPAGPAVIEVNFSNASTALLSEQQAQEQPAGSLNMIESESPQAISVLRPFPAAGEVESPHVALPELCRLSKLGLERRVLRCHQGSCNKSQWTNATDIADALS